MKKWEHAGFISGKVWSHLDNIIDSETIKTSLSTSIDDQFETLCEDDEITEKILSCASRNILSSRKLQFAMEMLRFTYHQYSETTFVYEGLVDLTRLKVCRK